MILSYIHEHVDDSVTTDLIQYVADRKGHDRRYGIDPAKIKADLGWEPETMFAEGIKKTIDWYLANGEWMNMIFSRKYQL
jgi:dTDP-glucose 4,6-dehydratase